ncbi:hypothetical protein QWJ46_16735 [Rhizobium sp. CBN3]|uniref:hypothetical protein n=1 Tax=Rhizobium sp. CBN3 TaxID=3058045 RepID=UPI002672EABF|nr:hypothetical protein [Rhizobium sp. CBN3]MDO3434328.1 hypothetical protein [Rhizobium sp. CBN3]
MRLAILFLLLFTSVAEARQVSLGRSGSSNVFIWRDNDAFSEAVNLISSGVMKTNPQLIIRLMSCMVDAGTNAVVTDGGFFSSTVLITSGSNAGCRGMVPNEDIRN